MVAGCWYRLLSKVEMLQFFGRGFLGFSILSCNKLRGNHRFYDEDDGE